MITKEQDFQNSLRIILDLIQLLKYNLEVFKGHSVHKEVLKQKDMRPDVAALQLSLNAFVMKQKQKCSPDVFRGLMTLMSRDQLHDISCHLDVIYGIQDLSKITEFLREEIKKQAA